MSWALLAIVGYCKMHYNLGYAIVNNGLAMNTTFGSLDISSQQLPK
jgi:hypothetical protein